MRKLIVLSIVCLMLSSMESYEYQCILENEFVKEQTNELSNELKIKEYLSSTVGEIMELSGADFDDNSFQIVFEPNVFYPCIYLKDEPFVVICRNKEKNLTPIYILFYESSIILKPLNLRKDMEFSEIMVIMGETSVEQSGHINKYKGGNTIYKIEYAKNGLTYTFCSYNKNGKNFELYVGLQTN